MAAIMPLQLHSRMKPTFQPTFSTSAGKSNTPNICRFCRRPRSSYHENTPPSSSDETIPSKQQNPSEDDIQKIKMDVSPSVLKNLDGQCRPEFNREEEGLGLIERNRMKRAALFAAKEQKSQISIKNSPMSYLGKEGLEDTQRQDSDDKQKIYEEFKSNLPILQKPGNLVLYRLFNFAVENMDLEFVFTSRILIGSQNQKTLDQNLIRECRHSIFIADQFRTMGGLKFERDKKWYSERLALLIVYDHLVDQMGIEIDEGKNGSKAEKLASALALLEPLVMTVVAPELLILYAFENSGFVPDGRIVKYEEGFIFPGRLRGHIEDARDQIQKYLDLTGQDNVVFFMKSRRNGSEDWCVIAPWSWLLGTILPDKVYNWISGFSFVGTFVGALQFRHADPGLELIVWEAMVIPSLLLGIVGAGSAARWFVASKYDNVAQLIRWPIVFPFMSFGAIGTITGYRGCLPDRSCFLNLSLASVSTSMALSSLVVLLGYLVGSADAFSDSAVDFHGYSLVPLDMLSYSGFFTFLLRKLSITSFSEEMGSLEFVINSVSLAGLLGLSFCSFQLLPISRSDGARILAAILGRETQQKITGVVKLLLPIYLLFKNPLLAFAWTAYVVEGERLDDLFQREEVSEPSLYTKILGLGLVFGALASFVPVLW